MRKVIMALITSLCICQKGIGGEQIGPVHGIAERDMLEEISRVLNEKQKSGELAKLQQQAVERTKNSIENPKSVIHLEKAMKSRTFYWDPTIRVSKPVIDQNGRVIAAAGTTINPLDYVSLPEKMYFFDGSDNEQVTKMRALLEETKGAMKPIMVKGKPLELSRNIKRQVYFDQGGELVRKLGLVRVPSLVSQEGKLLRIDEMAN